MGWEEVDGYGNGKVVEEDCGEENNPRRAFDGARIGC